MSAYMKLLNVTLLQCYIVAFPHFLLFPDSQILLLLCVRIIIKRSRFFVSFTTYLPNARYRVTKSLIIMNISV